MLEYNLKLVGMRIFMENKKKNRKMTGRRMRQKIILKEIVLKEIERLKRKNNFLNKIRMD